MSEFKVGDKVVAKKNAPYAITRDGWEGSVVSIQDAGYMDVCGWSPIYMREHIFLVESKYFRKKCDGSKIVITTDGKTTTAKLYKGDKVTNTAEAHCSPDDTFDFCEGAKIALERLTTKKEKFVPHLYNVDTEEDYGEIGNETKYEDVVGRRLYVGDVVELYHEGALIATTLVVEGTGSGRKKQFIRGIERDCDDEKGTICGGWEIIKTRFCEAVEDGEIIHLIKFVKKPD